MNRTTQRRERTDSTIATMETRSRVPTEHYREAREQVHSETLGCRDVSEQCGFVNTLTEACASAKDAAACTANCTDGIPEGQFLGWRPVWLTAKLDAARCRERKTPKWTDKGGRVGVTESARLTLVPLVFTFSVATPRVLQTLCGKSAESACN